MQNIADKIDEMPKELRERALEYVTNVELRYERGKFMKWACFSICAVLGVIIGLVLYFSGSFLSKAVFSREGLDACYDEFIGDTMIKDAITDELLSIAYDFNNQEPRLYSKKFIELDPGIYDVEIGFASGASASMPGGFPPQTTTNQYGLEEVLIDGGVLANNPSMMARLIAMMKPENRNKKIRILSLSCGESPKDPNEKVDVNGFQKLTYVTDVFDWMTAIQQEVTDFYLGAQYGLDYDETLGFVGDDYIRVVIETEGNFLSAAPDNVRLMEDDGMKMWLKYEEPLKNFIRITMDERFVAGVMPVPEP